MLRSLARAISVAMFGVIVSVLVAAPKAAEKPKDPAMLPVTDDPNLPRVMLIGDSISIGYTIPVREMLKGKANVHRPPANCGDTARGIQFMERWLEGGKWDVIHFNFGLHDLKYLDANGKYVPPDKGKQVATPEQYEQNLRKIVEMLKKTNARLIWATTTPVPDGSLGRVKGDEAKYNEVAAKVMKELGVEVDDLCAVATAKQKEIQLPQNVHFTKEGYQELGKTVSARIEKALKK